MKMVLEKLLFTYKFHLSLIYFILFVVGILFMTSCGSNKILYDPTEVAYLSEQLKIPIANNDSNIPLYAEISLWLGTPYRYGGNTKEGADCSGLVNQIFTTVYNKQLQRSANDQAKKNVRSVKKRRLKAGDLVFFNTLKNSKKVDHVGIFLKNNYFIHASTSKGVIVSNLEESYYKKNWAKGGRVK